MRYILDTDVLSQTTKLRGDGRALAWMRAREESDLWLSAITIEELRYGTESMPDGVRRAELEAWLEERVLRRFAGRVLAIDERIADRGGRLFSACQKASHNADIGDVLIAATALVHGMKVASLNRRDFERLNVELVTF